LAGDSTPKPQPRITRVPRTPSPPARRAYRQSFR
jgi:hypothetical protein